jgi:hypothetical protein
MSSRNFNTAQMKINFFDIDEEDRNVSALGENSFKKLLKAIDYAAERALNRELNVRMYVILDPEMELTSELTASMMEHIDKRELTLIATTEDTISVQLKKERFVVTIKLLGGATLVVTPFSKNKDDSDSGSDAENFEDLGLTQECRMIPEV